MRLAGQAKGGFYPTPERVVNLIADLVGGPTGYHHRNLESHAHSRPLLRRGGGGGPGLAERMQSPGPVFQVDTYGVELHRERARGGR